jgi:hypothetical protein
LPICFGKRVVFFRRERVFMFLLVYRLFLEYARVMDPQRDSMSFDPSRVRRENNVRFKERRREKSRAGR